MLVDPEVCMPNVKLFAKPLAFLVAVLIAAPAAALAQGNGQTYDRNRLLAGHLLRRIGFGPTRKEMKTVLKKGIPAYLEQQLNPQAIDDSAAEAKYFAIPQRETDTFAYMRRWYTRMVYSRRQLVEKMTLTWHEHFATSIEKVRNGDYMHAQEEMLRRNALGNFRQLIVDVTRDNAMLIFLDNDPNNGQAVDDQGNPIPPNENYARELLQLFTLGPNKLRMDGSVVIDANGQPVPNYSETDVRELARALTGWDVPYRRGDDAQFIPDEHDFGDKTIMGTVIHGRSGPDGANEVEDVADLLMSNASLAPFISKMLIQKLATETPTPGYVERVSTAFATSRGDIKATLRAIILDPEFTSDAVVRTQFKTPIEQFVGMVRAFDGESHGSTLVLGTNITKHQIYYPPSVFSFYRPGDKKALVNTALAISRDSVSDALTNGYTERDGYLDTAFDARKLIKKYKLKTPEAVVDYVSDALLAAPLRPEARQVVVNYFHGRVDEEKFRGAVWLIACSPDFQRN